MQNPKNIATFNKLFNKHCQKLVYFAMGYIKDEGKSQDFVSDAFCTFWEKKDALVSAGGENKETDTRKQNK